MKVEIKNKARHLCSYITDRSAVLAHINRDYGTSYTMKDLSNALTYYPQTTRRQNIEGGFLPLTPPITTHIGKGYDPLAIALFKYHAARTTGADKRHWEQKLAKVF